MHLACFVGLYVVREIQVFCSALQSPAVRSVTLPALSVRMSSRALSWTMNASRFGEHDSAPFGSAKSNMKMLTSRLKTIPVTTRIASELNPNATPSPNSLATRDGTRIRKPIAYRVACATFIIYTRSNTTVPWQASIVH